MMNKAPLWLRIVSPMAVFLLVALVWHVLVVALRIPEVILPKPTAVLNAMWADRWTLLMGSWVTLQAAGAGMLVSTAVGCLVAILFSQSSLLRTALYPYVIFLQTVPIVAIAPLLIVWSGLNFRTVVLVSCIICIFPIISNVTSGLIAMDQNHVDLFRMQGGSRWQTLTKLRIPAAIPNLVLGLRISCGLSVIGAIVGELFVSNSTDYDGLGTIMNAMQAQLKTAQLIGAVIACTLLGILLFLTVQGLDAWVLRRWTRNTGRDSQ
jgi:NitT/TauT family transport system permease protein